VTNTDLTSLTQLLQSPAGTTQSGLVSQASLSCDHNFLGLPCLYPRKGEFHSDQPVETKLPPAVSSSCPISKSVPPQRFLASSTTSPALPPNSLPPQASSSIPSISSFQPSRSTSTHTPCLSSRTTFSTNDSFHAFDRRNIVAAIHVAPRDDFLDDFHVPFQEVDLPSANPPVQCQSSRRDQMPASDPLDDDEKVTLIF